MVRYAKWNEIIKKIIILFVVGKDGRRQRRVFRTIFSRKLFEPKFSREFCRSYPVQLTGHALRAVWVFYEFLKTNG